MVEGEGERDGECASERSYMIERERERAHTQLAIHDREKGKGHTQLPRIFPPIPKEFLRRISLVGKLISLFFN